jgi:hypothetical protein
LKAAPATHLVAGLTVAARGVGMVGQAVSAQLPLEPEGSPQSLVWREGESERS